MAVRNMCKQRTKQTPLLRLKKYGKATSDSCTPSATSTYYFEAKYLGDANYDPSESGDKEKPLTVKMNSWLSDTSDQRLEVTDFRIVFAPSVSHQGGSHDNILYVGQGLRDERLHAGTCIHIE